MSSWRSLAVLAAALLLALLPAAPGGAAETYAGRPLRDVLEELRAGGLAIAYSSNLVPDTLVVGAEPEAREPLALLREVLAPHGLALREAGGAWLVVRAEPPAPMAMGTVVVAVTAADTKAPVQSGSVQADPPNGPSARIVAGRAELEGLSPGRHSLSVRADGFLAERLAVDVAAGTQAEAAVALAPEAPKLEELTVTASRYDVANEIRPSSSYFSRDQIEGLSELGGDTLRMAHRLPGIAVNEFSARSHVRGGAADEMPVVFDGVELIEPYHLPDYQALFSAIDQRVVAGTQIYSGGFPAEYGDGLSGLTVIDPREPTELEQEVGVSLLYTSLLSGGTFDDGRGDWLVSFRRSNLDLLLDEHRGDPSYRDVFVHVRTRLGAKHTLTVTRLSFDDDILATPENGPAEIEHGVSDTDARQFWIKVDSDWSDALSSRSIVQASELFDRRSGLVADANALVGTVNDGRRLERLGVKQDWRWRRSDAQLLTFGFERTDERARYEYASDAEPFGPLAALAPPPGTRAATLAPSGAATSAYFADRVRATPRLILDLGLRWDRESWLPAGDESQSSPRASLLYRLSASTDLRLSYGRYFQAEGLLDLPVEDAVTAFAPAQDAAHSIVGAEHRFANGIALRAELFRKWTKNPRARYENLFDPLVLLPELRAGRVRVGPDRAESRGAELLVTGERPFEWWAGYSYSFAEDLIAGERVPRAWDQRHAVSAGASVDVGAWSLSGVLTAHSGWPTTDLALVTVEGSEPIAVLGPRNAERLPSSVRLDFRASKAFPVRVGALRFVAEITNLTDRRNPCCVAYEVRTDPGGAQRLERELVRSLPLTGNVGILWSF